MTLNQAVRRTHWGRSRYQFAGAILFACILPYIIRLCVVTPDELLPGIHQTLAFGIAAVCSGFWLNRNFRTYPGVEDSSYILSSITGSFGLSLLLITAFRLDYSRGLLIGQYIAAVCWFYTVYFKLQRRHRLRIGVIQQGGIGTPKDFTRVEWVPLENVDDDVDGLDAITVNLRADLPDAWERRLADFALADIRVFHHKHLLESLTGRVELEHVSENSFGTLSPLSTYMTIKHIIDWVCAALLLVVLSPLLVMVGVMIRLDTPGPAIFRQRRIGYQGRVFEVYKFRTMRQAAAAAQPALRDAMTQADDARITKLGRFLRRSRLDELPQLINVLKGEMSWIGPRPEAEVLSRWYETELPFYRYRHIVRPGITGWAQVLQGHVSELDDVRDKLHYDFYYIKNYSASCDVLIIFRTIRIMFTGFGAR
jgi:lipopolysaccharide/colanic/teichoic acid biosynthesis glycosyltransferase